MIRVSIIMKESYKTRPSMHALHKNNFFFWFFFLNPVCCAFFISSFLNAAVKFVLDFKQIRTETKIKSLHILTTTQT